MIKIIIRFIIRLTKRSLKNQKFITYYIIHNLFTEQNNQSYKIFQLNIELLA